jgi:small subunit ribosomal protein S4
LVRKGLVREGSPLDGVLNLTVEDVLARRLQSMIFKKGMAASPLQARQAIVHGHVVVGERRVTVPSYPVARSEEGAVKLLGGHRSQTPKVEAVPTQVE